MRAPVDEDQATAGPAEPRPPAVQPRTVTMLVCGFAAALLFAVVGLVPVPYAIMKPGPVRDTLSAVDGHPLIEVSGRRTYPTDGTLDLTTVSVFGGPGHRVDVLDVVSSWLDPTEAVVPEEELFAPDQTEQEVEERNSEAMVTSQENATAAAMGELGITVPTTLTIAGFSRSSRAEGPLHEGDVITAIDGTVVPDLPQLREQLQTVEPGTEVTVSVQRDGERVEVPVTTSRSSDGDTLLGVLVDPTYHFPFEVSIQIENIGGPSAGMMFALGIVDKLTPGPMTGGEKIAGTGTIDSGGSVGPIGGIQQKLVGARRAGAQWFLAPAGNCAEVVGHVPDGLRVVKVADLHQARQAVEAIGDGDAADLATCG